MRVDALSAMDITSLVGEENTAPDLFTEMGFAPTPQELQMEEAIERLKERRPRGVDHVDL